MKELAPPIRKDRKPLWELLPLKQPLRINIDPCDVCNFKCDFCFQSKEKEFRGNVMTVEMFEKAIVQLKEFDAPINVIHLYGLGEPFLNRNLPQFIRRIKEENAAKEVKTTTNGSLLTHSLIDELVEAGLDEITISLNGLKDEDFERIVNTKICFDRMLDNIQYLYAHKRSCHVHIKIIGDYFSKKEQEYFVKIIGEYADTINIDGATNHWSGFKDTAKEQQQYKVGGGTFKEWPVCAFCFYELAVHSDGSVSPCSADWQKDKQNLGNITESSLKEIWESEKRREMLISFLKGTKNPYAACRECEYPGSGAGVNLEPYKEELLKKYV